MAYVKNCWKEIKELCESHFSTGCSKAMPGKDSEIKIEIDEKVPDTGMHQAWREPAWVPGGL